MDRSFFLRAAFFLSCAIACGSVFPAQPPGAGVASAPPALVANVGGQKWSLLIGVDDYAEMDALAHVSSDLRGLQGSLIAGGFSIDNSFVMDNKASDGKYLPSNANIQRQLELLPQLVGNRDTILIVFCGHGIEHNGKSYLCPMDANLAKSETLVELDLVFRQLAASAAEHKLLVLDVARRTPAGLAGSVDGFLRSLAKVPKSITLVASCQPGEASLVNPKLERGLYLSAFARGLQSLADKEGGNGDGRVSLGEVLEYAAAQTAQNAASVGGKSQTAVQYGREDPDLDLVGLPKYAPDRERYPTVQDDPAEASARLEALVQINPKSARAYALGVERYGRGDLMEAIEYCNDAIRLDPGNSWAHILRASCYAAHGNLAMAVEDYRKLGIPFPCRVVQDQAEIRRGNERVATISRGQKLYISRTNGDWLWVESIDGDKTRQGWIHQKSVE